MDTNKLNKILDDHKLWLKTNGEQGEHANLSSANLSSANLRSADLRYANLRSADLNGADLRSADLNGADLRSADLNGANLSSANLRSADLRYANLRCANLRYADLRSADLNGADLRYADLRYANLRYADLRGADLDYSALPLWCGGTDMHIDDKLAKQLLWHLVQSVQFSKNTTAAMKKLLLTKAIIKRANEFHRINSGCIKAIEVKDDAPSKNE